MLKTTTDRAICGAWTFDTALDTSYQNAVQTALRRVLERVTFVPEVLTTQQLKARGFDAQIIIGQGDAESRFSVPAYVITGTAHGDIGLSVTVSIRAAAGPSSQETVSARGQGRAQISGCSGVANAISAGAKSALGIVARGVVRSVQERLDIRTASRPSNPKAVAASRQSVGGEGKPSDDDDQPMGSPDVEQPHDEAVISAQQPREGSAEARDQRVEPRVEPRDKGVEPPEERVAALPSSPPTRARPQPGPLSPEEAFQRGVDAVAGRGGMRRNDADAVRWFRMAAEQGYAPAENNLGYMYAEGRGVTRDDQRAVEWYRRAADRGYPPAQTSLAMMVSAGRGAPRNDLQALALYSAASGQGYAPATANVAQMYAEGRGIMRDEDTAAFLLATSGEMPRSGSGIFVDGE